MEEEGRDRKKGQRTNKCSTNFRWNPSQASAQSCQFYLEDQEGERSVAEFLRVDNPAPFRVLEQ